MAKAKDANGKGDEWGDEVESNFPEVWEPAEGDELIGRYMGSETIPGSGNRQPFQSYRVLDADGKMWAFSGAMLASKMEQIPLETKVKITFDGMEDTNNGPAKTYTVVPAKGSRLLSPAEVARARSGHARREAGAGSGAGGRDTDAAPFK